jgi:hypothetical protein
MQQITQGYMVVGHGLNGRFEKRLPIIVVVNLTHAREESSNNGAELTYTENVSEHGACVVSKRPWERGEEAEITSLKEQTVFRGKVIHCKKRDDDRYNVGFLVQGRQITWSTYRTYAGI